MQQKILKRILWIVNVFESNELRFQIINLLKTLAVSTTVKVDLVSFLGIKNEFSLKKNASRLISFAKEAKSDAIIISTRARNGLIRFFSGSFTETLLLLSPIPVIVVNPRFTKSKSISHVLFPTDFGQPSRRAFEKTVSFAKELKARITLFFKEPPIINDLYFIAPNTYENIEQEIKSRRALAQSWLCWAKNQGVSVDVKMDERPSNVSEAIVDFASTKNVDLISMAAQSGSFSSALLGSVSRQVIRKAHCPVWIRRS